MLHRKQVLSPTPRMSKLLPTRDAIRQADPRGGICPEHKKMFLCLFSRREILFFFFFSLRKLFYFLKNMEVWSWDISEPEQYRLPCKSIQVPWEVLKTAGLLSVLAQNQPHKGLLKNIKFLRSCGEFKVEEGSGERKEMTKLGQLVTCESST